MTWMIYVALMAWPPLSLLIYSYFGRERGLALMLVLGFLFLPQYGFYIDGLPNISKSTVVILSALLCCLVYDPQRLFSVRPSLWDLPVLAMCILPTVTSLSNDLGLRDGLSASLATAIVWLIPYWIGRTNLATEKGLHAIAYAVLVGALIYIPLCLIEMRMSPQLHIWVYGFHQHTFSQAIRFGGYRPTVFLPHGLIVALWMTAGTIVAAWLWRTNPTMKIGNWSIGLVSLLLLVVTVMCRSVNAVVLLGLVAPLIFMHRVNLKRYYLLLLMLAAPAYISLRLVDQVPTTSLAATVGEYVGRDREQSVQTRFHNEDVLKEKALQRPWFGWGGWGRSRVYNEQGKNVTITDGRWVIYLGTGGIVRVVSFIAAMLVPLLVFIRRHPVSQWNRPALGPAAALITVVIVATINDTMNAASIPIFYAALGALSGAHIHEHSTTRPVIVHQSKTRFI